MAMAASRVPVARRFFLSRMFMGLVVVYALTARLAVYEYVVSNAVIGNESPKPLPAPFVKVSAKIRPTKTEFLSSECARGSTTALRSRPPTHPDRRQGPDTTSHSCRVILPVSPLNDGLVDWCGLACHDGTGRFRAIRPWLVAPRNIGRCFPLPLGRRLPSGAESADQRGW
jgi:hypothetical protein